MKIRKGIAALLAALMLLSVLPTLSVLSALAEPADEAMQPEEAEAFEESVNVEPEVGLAEDAGDTGLTVDDSDAPDEVYEPGTDLPGDETVTEGDAIEAPDALDGEEGLEILALPVVSVGYAAIAPEAPVYADAARTRAFGVFPDGAAVYVEAVESDGMMLMIRFDTEDSRGWDQPIPTGYVSSIDALAYTAEESDALTQTLSADARTRWLDGAAIPCVAFTALDFAVMAGENVVGLGVAAHTQAEIQAFANAHPAYRNQVNIYRVAATDKPYTVGKLSAVNQQSGLNLINQIRYIAGLNADVGLLDAMEEDMAATALVLRVYSEQYKAANGKDILTHYPPRAAVLADAGYDGLYAQGYAGAGRSNIAMGYSASSSILAYMSDADDNNVRTVGHRRWILNPSMGRTVFGANGRFTAMYAHDTTGAGSQTKVAWPAQEMPRQYFSAGDPWSLSYGRLLSADKVSVSLVRVRDGKTWNFSATSADGAFFVENSAYGQKGCVIFRPNGLGEIAAGDTFNVSVTDAESGEITRYTVRFFDLDLTAATPMDALSVTALKTRTGNEVGWNAASGATGYYVCRRTSDVANFQIIADVSGTAYKDTAVTEDKTYYYQVFAHNASIASRSAISVEAKPVPPDAVTLNVNGTVTQYRNIALQLTATLAPASAMSKLTWKSSKPKVASVDANGYVTPLKKGSTIISVTTENGKSASVKIKVVNPPKAKRVILSVGSAVTMNVGDTLMISGTVEPAEAEQKLSWSTSRRKIASVSGVGLVTALSAGTATITAKSASGRKARVKVRVVDPYAPTAVALSHKGTVLVNVGQTLQLGATVAPDTAKTTLTWTSSRRSVATVDGGGLVTAVKAGSATITVRTANGKKARVKIKVVK